MGSEFLTFGIWDLQKVVALRFAKTDEGTVSSTTSRDTHYITSQTVSSTIHNLGQTWT